MRIGMLADIYKTQVSGVTHSIALSKLWLEKAGHEVFVFTFGDDEVVDHELNIIRTAGVPVVDTGIYLNLRYNRYARHLLYTMDIVHVHHPFVSGSLALRYCVPRNIPIVFTNHTRYDLLAQAYLPLLPEPIGEAALKAYLSPFYRACDLVIIPSPSMRAILVEHFGLDSPVEVIPNGLDLSSYRAQIEPVERTQLGFSPGDIVIIYVGRLSPEKNLPLLLRAFYGVTNTFDNIRLLIVGDGPERENLAAQLKHMHIQERVCFTGMVAYDEVPAYLRTADIFVTPSSAETFGLSTIEAMAAGLPVLGIDAPGTTDVIENGINGLISSDDLALFTAKLVYLSTDDELRHRLGQQGRLASQQYDVQATTKILIERYQRLIEAARNRKKGVRYQLTRMMDRFR
jgi:1,2-diacylglycerol 3-alpha-glucosyltransferase